MHSHRNLVLPRTIYWLLCICLLSPWVHGQQKNPHNTLGFWQAILPFGAEQPLNKQQQAFFELGRYLELMDFWRKAMYAPVNEKPLWTQFRQDIQNHDQNRFFSNPVPYLNNKQPESPSLSFEGNWQQEYPTEQNYGFSISNQTAGNQKTKHATNTFGNLQGKITFLPGSIKPDNVLSEFDISLNLGPLLFSEILESIEAMNRAFQPDRLVQYERDHEVETPNNSSDDEMSSIDQALLARFLVSLPNSMKTLMSISNFEKFVTLDSTPSGKQATRINHRQRINLKALKQKYSDTYDDFKDLLNSVSFVSEICTQDDKILGRFSYDAGQKLASADMAFVGGGFVLQNQQGELLDQIIFPTQLETFNYKIVNTMKVSMFGLKVAVDKFTIEAHYDAGLGMPRTDRNAKIFMAMANMPAIDVSGAFLYIIPSWLIDLFIPGTIETLIANSFEDLVTGNNGNGLTLNVIFNEQNNQHTLRLAALAELPYKVIQALVKTEQDEENKQPARLYRTMRADLRRDFASKATMFTDPRLSAYIKTLRSK